MNFQHGTSTIVGQANAQGAMAVAAVRYTQTPAYGVNNQWLKHFHQLVARR